MIRELRMGSSALIPAKKPYPQVDRCDREADLDCAASTTRRATADILFTAPPTKRGAYSERRGSTRGTLREICGWSRERRVENEKEVAHSQISSRRSTAKEA